MPAQPPSSEPATDSRKTTSPPRPGDVLSLDLDLLDDNPFQPRVEMDPTKLEELAASITKSGLLQPIAIRPNGPGRYQIVAGHRRVAAFRKLRAEAKTEATRREYELIRAHVVGAVTDSEMAVAAYVKNTARDNLNPLDEAAALARIRELGANLSASEVAKVTGQPERRVRRLLKLADAPQVVKNCVTAGVLVEASESPEPSKRERRRIDLLAALEFTRLHQHHTTKKAATADERTTTAMTRALLGNWGLRRIQSYVDGVINGTSHTEPITANQPAAPATAPPARDKGAESGSAHELRDVCSSSSDRFTLHLSRLKAASRQQLEAARVTLDDIRQLIEAQLQLKA